MFYSIDLNAIIIAAATHGNVFGVVKAALGGFKDGADREKITGDLSDTLLAVKDLASWQAMTDPMCVREAHPHLMAWIAGEDDIFVTMTNCLDIDRAYENLGMACDDLGGQVTNGDKLLTFVVRYIGLHLHFVRWCVGENVKDVRDEDTQWTMYRQDLDREASALARNLTDHVLGMML